MFCSQGAVKKQKRKSSLSPPPPPRALHTPLSTVNVVETFANTLAFIPPLLGDWIYPRIWAYFGAKKIEPSSDTLLTAASGHSFSEATVDAVVHLFCVYNTFLFNILDEILNSLRFGIPGFYCVFHTRSRLGTLCSVMESSLA